MANALQSYVENFILNPSAPIAIDEDGFQDHYAKSSKVVEQHIEDSFTGASKLRIKNTPILGDRDPKYKGKKVTRKTLKGDTNISYDPELSKYFLVENDSDSDKDDKDNESHSEEENDSIYESCQSENETENNMLEQDFMKLGDDEEEDDNQEDDDNEEDSDNEQDTDNEDVDCDIGNDENNFGSGLEEEIDSGNEEIESSSKEKKILTFSKTDNEEIQKGESVKNQYNIFDTLFEARIGMQKMIATANQLPQCDTYRQFLNENDPHFKANLQNARKSVKKLVNDLLLLQETLLQRNIETSQILDKYEGSDDSDLEVANHNKESPICASKKKRGKKRQVEEYGNILNKRHKLLIPYRNDVLNKWHSKTSLLVNRSSRSKFSNFEISAVQQMKNILANKSQLIQRTQLRSLSRGNVYNILGKIEDKTEDSLSEIYDPEIYDDTDFYSRMLEDILKSKMSLSEDMTDVSRKWIEIQNLRKKAKKKVDTKASKGRKIRYEVMSKLQQFSAPCKSSLMNDQAINMLYSSLFGRALTAMDSGR